MQILQFASRGRTKTANVTSQILTKYLEGDDMLTYATFSYIV